jgi:hypothetical protein
MNFRGGEMIAYCGLNCSLCDAYLATREDNDGKRIEIARKWSKMYRADIEPGQINCDGCKSDGVKFSHCSMCEIRRCCISNNVESCAACEDYICPALANFIKVAPEAGMALEKLRL